jgi:hypothetical protein
MYFYCTIQFLRTICYSSLTESKMLQMVFEVVFILLFLLFFCVRHISIMVPTDKYYVTMDRSNCYVYGDTQ